ncbi:unnamed protein product (macronuclear) [Paramecium tetraurelia]|uniref:RING-type domain-containing protein n=1 Tax=Paramecium tetraurelia TaxID=5888 RepID=A0CL65_PARTE|nr:uncharacterized protein GSPATT00008079001 [Paramecium tetraurelia]CAK71532.1 unnamed protein product [Paramecium tetraurelia]|eukprot:XP_001438929.1 hypothetical protein (macronuclear) [Paramecium tetraurelia strain d4-2]
MIDTTPIPKFLQQEFECSLCLTFLTNPITIPCGHTFCKECISNAVKQIPRCPTCRFQNFFNFRGTITIEIKNLKENLLIKSTVNELKKHLSIADNPQKQQIENKEENNQQSEKLIILYTKEVITPYQYQRIVLEKGQFKSFPKNQELIKQIFSNIKKFVITFQSKQNQDIGYLAQLQLVQIIDGQITAQILTEDIVELSNKEQTEFQLNNDGQIKYFLPIATAKILQEDYIDLNDNDTSYQISTLIQQIKDVLLPFIQQLSNGQSGLSLYLHQSGLVILEIIKKAIIFTTQSIKY